MKGHHLSTAPVADTGVLTSRWFSAGLVEFELIFGLWLLGGLFPKATRRAATLCFAGFGCVSFSRALNGADSCGCFGVPVSPVVPAVLDMIAVGTLLVARPRRSLIRRERRCMWRRGIAIAAISLLLGIPAAVAMMRFRSEVMGTNGEIRNDAATIVLEPGTWRGERFPLLDHVDVGSRLRHGRWIVVLHRHGCAKCEMVIPQFEELARKLGAPHVALIELPPFGTVDANLTSSCLNGRLSDHRQWFVETPIVCWLDDGMVTDVTTPEHGSAGTPGHVRKG